MNIRRIIFVVSSAGAGACIYGDPGTAVHPDPDARADSLAFHIFVFPDSAAPNRKLRFIEVISCGDSSANRRAKPVWKVERLEVDRSAEPTSPYIHFGVAPAAGWSTAVPASPLTPGRYQVLTVGGGIGAGASFDVDSSGRIRNDIPWDFDCR
jgi:hypothetical protein